MKNVLCVGEILIDFICSDKGVSLKQGEHFLKKVGGAPFNAAIAIQKLGAKAYMCGAVGYDQFGELLIDELNKYEVDTSNVVMDSNKNTTLAFVSLSEDGERDFSFVRGADEFYKYEDIDIKTLESSEIFHFGSATAFLGGNLEKTYYKLLDYACENNKVVIFDPNYRELLFGNKKELFITHSKAFAKKAFVVKVSDDEAFLITGTSNIVEAGEKLIGLGSKYVLITCGSDGTFVFTKRIHKHIKTEPVKMVDATGAGDAFIGSVISQIANSSDIIDFDTLIKYVEIGNKVGRIVVQRYGAIESIPSKEEIFQNYSN